MPFQRGTSLALLVSAALFTASASAQEGGAIHAVPLEPSAEEGTLAGMDRAMKEKLSRLGTEILGEAPEGVSPVAEPTPVPGLFLYRQGAQGFLFRLREDRSFWVVGGDLYPTGKPGQVGVKTTGLAEPRKAAFDANPHRLRLGAEANPEAPVARVFLSPDCPHCKRFYQRVIAPLVEEGVMQAHVTLVNEPQGVLGEGVICAQSPEEALERAYRDTTQSWPVEEVDEAACETRLEAHERAANLLGVNRVPATLFPDGYLLKGGAPKGVIKRRLSENR